MGKKVPPFSQKRMTVFILQVLPDLLAISIAAILSYNLRFRESQSEIIYVPGWSGVTYQEFLFILVLLWIATLWVTGTYKVRHIVMHVNFLRVILRSTLNLFLGIGLLSYLTKAEFSRSIFLLFFLTGLALIFSLRALVVQFIIRPLVMNKKIFTSVVLIGVTTRDLDEYTNWLVENRKMGFKINGRIVCSQIDFDWINRFDSLMHDYKAEEVLLLPGIDVDKNFAKFIHYLQDLKIPINWIPHDSGNLGYWQTPYPQDGLPFLTFKDSVIPPIGRFTKRLFDIVFSAVSLALLSPIFLIIGSVIALKDGRPVFFIQLRVGKEGKPFKMYKFRTMVPDADKLKDSIANQHGSTHVLFKNQKDPRITATGSILRKFSLDELPQFVNSLVGSMSIVGPRPALPREANVFSSLYERRLLVKPGITGPWQISGRSDLDLSTSVALDLNYVSSWSFSRDLWIILSTFGAVIRKKGAY